MYIRVTCIYVIELVWATDFLIYGKLSTDGWDHLEINMNTLGVYTCIPTGHMWTLSLSVNARVNAGRGFYSIGCAWYTVKCPCWFTQEAQLH